MAFILGAVLGAGASLIGGAMASSAASKAAKTQARSADKATELQRQMYEEGVVRQKPFYEAGITGQNRLMDILGLSDRTTAEGYGSAMRPFGMSDFQADPGYAFRMKEGLKGLDQQAAARGGLISGNALRAAQQYGQDLGSQEYQNAYNRYQTNRANVLNPLQSLLGQAQSTANTLGSAGQNYATNAGNTMMAAGAARASGYTGSADAWNRALGGAAGTIVSGLNANQMYGSGGYNPYNNYGSLAGGGSVAMPTARPGDF
jgi:hypothetical protein